MEINDYVYLNSDKTKILYVIKDINDDVAFISGVYFRIIRYVKIKELVVATAKQIENEREQSENKKKIFESLGVRNKKYLLGKVLHIDGDDEYLKKCLELYEKVNVYAYGVTINEENIKDNIREYILRLNPDIVVITGHDLYNNEGVKDINNYSNTKYFMDAVKEIRKIKSRYDCVVIAGACQSNFEALIASGADFASSPKRLNIHTFDPAIIAIRVATTSFLKVVNIKDLNRYIENGQEAFGGVETLGKMRLIL